MLKLHTAMYLWKYSKASGPRFGLNQYLTAAAMEDESQLGRSPRISVARTKAIYLPAWLIDASVIAMAEHITPRGVKPVPYYTWHVICDDCLTHISSGIDYRGLAEFVRSLPCSCQTLPHT